jgi:hypothetical protein
VKPNFLTCHLTRFAIDLDIHAMEEIHKYIVGDLLQRKVFLIVGHLEK